MVHIYYFILLAQIENSIAREPKIQLTQLKQRNMSGMVHIYDI